MLHRTALAAACMVISAGATAAGFQEVEAAALRGDYQAQRNIAFGYGSQPYAGQPKNPLLACAWRHVILHSGSQRVDQTDVNNFEVTCGSLDVNQRAAAVAQGRALFDRVYRRKAPF